MAESPNAKDLLKRGVAAAQAGQKEQARQLLQQSVRLDPQNELTWLWLSSVAKDNQERIFCLRQLLAINPQNEMALKGLRALGVATHTDRLDVAAPAEQSGAPGVPVISDQALAVAQSIIDELLETYGAQVEPDFGYEWSRKTKGRAGEQRATRLTAGIATASVVVVVVLCGVLAVIFGPMVIRQAAAPTATPTVPPPTVTPTPTLGPTNTPSPTPPVSPTPSSTYRLDVPPGATAFEEYGIPLTATEIHFRTPHGSLPKMEHVLEAYLNKDYEEAIRLAREVRAESPGFELELLDSYFYEGMSEAMMGDYDRAEAVFLAGFDYGEIVMLNAGLGYVYYKQGRFDESTEYNLKAIELDPRIRLTLPLLTQVDVYLARGMYDGALELMHGAFAQIDKEQEYNVDLVVKRGEIHLARGRPDDAIGDARLALYVDPFAENAYLLAANADIALGEYGAAVLDLQTYLYYYPGSIRGWALLGRARYGEGNLDAAIAAYDRALAADVENLDMQQAHLERAAMYMERHLYPQAFGDYDSALKIGASREALEGRALTAFYTGDFDKARFDLEALLEETPGEAAIQLMLGETLVYIKEYEKAEETLSSLLNAGLTDEQTARLHDFLARIYYHQAEDQPEDERDATMVERAATHINTALSLGSTGSRHYYRGLIREMLGEPERAKVDYEWVLTWGDTYGYSFLVDASNRLDDINAALAGEEES